MSESLPKSGDNPDVVDVRDNKGRFAPGNKQGGRTPMPDWYRKKAPEALRVIAAMAVGPADDDTPHVKQLYLEADAETKIDCAKEMRNDVYGRAKQAVEVEIEDPLTPAMRALLALAVSAKPKEEDDNG